MGESAFMHKHRNENEKMSRRDAAKNNTEITLIKKRFYEILESACVRVSVSSIHLLLLLFLINKIMRRHRKKERFMRHFHEL